MSRIQDILSKAERDGTARRTRSLADEYAARPLPADPARAPRPLPDEPRTGAGGDAVLARGPAGSHTSTGSLHDSAGAGGDVRQGSRRDAAGAAAALPKARVTSYGPSGEPGLDEPGDGPAHAIAQLDQHLVAAIAPTSLAAEQYRSLRTRLKRVENGRALRTIAVTSPAKGDGKSLTAANLALTMAQEFQQRVLLMDADLRRPAVHGMFGLQEGPGLGEVLMGVADLDHALVRLPEHHLTVLPAGMPPNNPGELLGSAAMRRVLDTLRTRFDHILIDVPPVSPLADLQILAPLVDGLLLVVRAGITPKPAIERALAGLDSTKVLGLVLNEAGGERSDADDYEAYGYIAG
jgi:capsular exopolysaccharide synthesis family protein